MKKFLVFVLAFMLVFPFAACGGDEGETSAVFSAAEQSSKAESSVAESSVADESEDDESSAADQSTEVDNDQTAPEFIANFVSIGAVDTKVTANSNNSIALTGVDADMSYGAIVLYTPDYGKIFAQDLEECAVAVFDYSGELFGYAKTAFYAVGEAGDLEASADGFIIAAHSMQEAYIDRMENLASTETVFPHGLHLYTAGDYTVKKAETAPQIDGDFSEDEWGAYLTDEINAENPSWSYAQFETNNYYSTATYYTAYDDEYIYLCVVVKSPYHYCPITPATASDMWQYECIQVKVSSESPDSEYILTNFDHVANKTAANDGIVKSYAFAASDENETCYYAGYTGLAGCSRDDGNQLTVYEVAIPFSDFDITPEAGMKLGLTFSINSTNEEDIDAGVWKNITYRNGGGVIGRNDWSKIPVITLG